MGIVFVYGIHPHETPAVQLGELLEGDRTYRATSGIQRSTNYKRAMNSIGADLILDIHASTYPIDDKPSVPRKFFSKRHFVIPDIPLRNGKMDSTYKSALSDLRPHFPVFSVSHLIGRREYSRYFHFNSNGGLSKSGVTTRWTTRGWTRGIYQRVITGELWVPVDELEKNVSENVLHEFKDEILLLAEWMSYYHDLFLR